MRMTIKHSPLNDDLDTKNGVIALCGQLFEEIILLHDWEVNMGKYSVRGWQYWPDRREGQYRTRELNISPY